MSDIQNNENINEIENVIDPNNNNKADTIIFKSINYSEIAYVALYDLQTIPTLENYKSIIPPASEKNLTNSNILVPMKLVGDTTLGKFIVADKEISHGIEYVKDENGDLVLDELGNPVILVDNGVLYHKERTDDIKKKVFNSIIVYSNEIDENTGTNLISMISILKNSLSFESIINFCVKYILTVTLDYVNIVFNYVEEYMGVKKHNELYSQTKTLMESGHKNLYERVYVANSQDSKKDLLNVSNSLYESFLKDDSITFYPVKDLFSKNVPDDRIEVLKNYKINKFSDNSIRSMYTYFYYNNYATMKFIKEVIVKEDVEFYNTENLEDLNEISQDIFRKHIKLGFGEICGPYLYTWFQTKKFIYFIIYGSNSNNNIDVYRIKNSKNYEGLNEENFNLIIGKYANRIYFTINGELYVLSPETLNKQKVSLNKDFLNTVEKELVIEDKDKFDFEVKGIEEEYAEILNDIEDNDSQIYILKKEQIFLFILSKNELYKKYVNKYGYFNNVDKEDLLLLDDEEYSSAVDFVEKNEIVFTEEDKKKVIVYIKKPLENILYLIKWFDDLVSYCKQYKLDNNEESIKISYIEQFCKEVKILINPEYVLGETYDVMWNGVEGTTGVRNDLIFKYIKTGFLKVSDEDIGEYTLPDEGKYYLDFVEKLYSILYKYYCSLKFRDFILQNNIISIYQDQVFLFYDDFYKRFLEIDPTINISISKEFFNNYMNKDIYTKENIFDLEESFYYFYNSRLFKLFFEFDVSDTITLEKYVLREFLINKLDKESEDYFKEKERIENLTIEQVNEEFNNSYLNLAIENSKDDERIWSLEGLKNLNKLYKEVCETELIQLIAYSDKDTFYFNGEKYEDISIVDRIDDIPFKFGFCQPNYVCSNTWSNFINPRRPEFSIVKTYPSKSEMEKDLLNPIVDSQVQTVDDLTSILSPTVSYTVRDINELNKLLIVNKEFETFSELERSFILKGVVTTKTNLPNYREENSSESTVQKKRTKRRRVLEVELNDIFYVIDEEKYYKYDGNESTGYVEYDEYPYVGFISYVIENSKYYELKLNVEELNLAYEEKKDYPFLNSYAYVTELEKYYQLKEKDDQVESLSDSLIRYKWVLIDINEYRNQFLYKVYLVLDDNQSYKYNGESWVKINNRYNMEIGDIYQVDNVIVYLPVDITYWIKKANENVFEEFSPTEVEDYLNLLEEDISIGDYLVNPIIKFINDPELKEVTITINNLLSSDLSNLSKRIILKGGGFEEDLVYDITFEKVENDLFREESIIPLNYEIKVTPLENKNIYLILDQELSFNGVNITYEKEILPGDTGVKYYQWDGTVLSEFDMPFIEETNCANFALGPVYFNLYLEGSKLDVNKSLFKNKKGETLKVTQFEFSDMGDVVLVHNYNNDGQSYFGGIFSRVYLADSEGNPVLYGNSVVISKEFKDCFNWEQYSSMRWAYNDTDSKYELVDQRLDRIKSLFEISKSHYENLTRYYNVDNIIFSNALTLCIGTLKDGSKKLFIYSKNIKMITNYVSMPYNDVKLDINNYFVVLKHLWNDTIYNFWIDMTTGIDKNYLNRYLTSQRGMVVLDINSHTNEWVEQTDVSGAVSYYDIHSFYDQSGITDFYEANKLPKKEIL